MATIVENDTGRPPVAVPVDASLVTPVKSARVKNLPATDHPTNVATTGSSDRLVEYLYLIFIFSLALSYAITGAVLLAATSYTYFTIAGMALFWLIPVIIIRLPEAKPWDRWSILAMSAPFDLCAIFGIIMAEMGEYPIVISLVSRSLTVLSRPDH
ncbi:hypothetical protein M405DRAFT_56921 [Rhizopogon salebrosus TDB-379]|nr:hypothetical protein M405DRAFT_56921 [Rhizopogon salebrosus TDB-379]